MNTIEEFNSKLDAFVDSELSSVWSHNKHRTLASQIKNLVTKFYTENTSFLDSIELDKLSNSDNFTDCLLAAQHSKTSLSTLIRLSTHTSTSIRTYVALNTKLSIELLEIMSYDDSWPVRSAVAQNKNINVETLLRLASDNSYYVRYQVAINPNTTKAIINLLSNDENQTIRELAIKVLKAGL